jgi:cytochrome c oxidase subunit 1
VVHGRQPLWESTAAPTHVSGLATHVAETLVTTAVDALPDHREIFPRPTIWPFVGAIALTVFFIGTIFTPWAFVWGSIPVAVTLIGWFWPSPEETEASLSLEKPP